MKAAVVRHRTMRKTLCERCGWSARIIRLDVDVRYPGDCDAGGCIVDGRCSKWMDLIGDRQSFEMESSSASATFTSLYILRSSSTPRPLQTAFKSRLVEMTEYAPRYIHERHLATTHSKSQKG